MALNGKSHADLQVVFKGPALADGTMEVEDLAPSLLAIAQAAQRANVLLNGDESRLDVRVSANVTRASFHVDLSLITQSIGPLLPIVTSGLRQAKDIAELVFGGDFSLLGLFKALEGKHPDSVPHTTTGDGNVYIDVKGDGNKIEFKASVLKLARDPIERRLVRQAIRPVSKPGVNSLTVIAGREAETITKDDIASFTEVPDPDEVYEEERTVLLEIVAIVFDESSKWKFTDGGSKFWAKIEDEEFWRKLHAHEYEGGEGDRLLVRLLTRQQTMPKLKSEYYILEVLDIVKAARQLQFEHLDHQEVEEDE